MYRVSSQLLALGMTLASQSGCTCNSSHRAATDASRSLDGAVSRPDAGPVSTPDTGPVSTPDADATVTSDGGRDTGVTPDAEVGDCGIATDSGCAVGLIRADGGAFWACYDPSDPANRSGDLPLGCPSPVETLSPCLRMDGRCTLQRPDCNPEYDCECQAPPPDGACYCTPVGYECRESGLFGCIDDGPFSPPPECGFLWLGTYCSGSFYRMECSTTADCMPEPCAYPTSCVNRSQTTCRRQESCGPDGLCHVPISCDCVGGVCQAVYASTGCQ